MSNHNNNTGNNNRGYALRHIPLATVLLAAPGAYVWGDDVPVDPNTVTEETFVLEKFKGGPELVPEAADVSPGPSSPSGTGKPPRVGPNVRINEDQKPPNSPSGWPLGRSETTIAASEDGQYLVAGWNDAEGLCGMPFNRLTCPPGKPIQHGLSGYAYSTDGGLNWIDGGAPDAGLFNGLFTRGDPWMDRGGEDGNTFYYSNLAVDYYTPQPTPQATIWRGVAVHRGHFYNGNFAWEDVRVLQTPNYPRDQYDKSALAADKDENGDAYVSLTNFIQTCGKNVNGFGQIEVWRTHDSGNTWQGSTVVSPEQTFITDLSNPDCGKKGILQQASVPAIGPDDEVYVAWQYGPTIDSKAGTISPDADIMFARSTDGGETFDTPVKVADINAMHQNPPAAYNRPRFMDHVRMSVAQSGRYEGRVYVTYYSSTMPVVEQRYTPTCPDSTARNCVKQSLVSTQVYLRYSDDQGRTWSPAIPVAAAVPTTGVKRFWPTVNVEPGGNVDVVYIESLEKEATTTVGDYECNVMLPASGQRRIGTVSSLVDTYWVQSTDGGNTFSAPVKVSSATSNWCTAAYSFVPNFGDYSGADVGGNRVFPAWNDGRNGIPDAYFAHILGAGKSD